MASIESVEFLRYSHCTSVYGPLGGSGRIFVITTKPRVPKKTSQRRISYIPQSLHVYREFYKPTYEAKLDDASFRGLRTLIHWEPSLVLNRVGVTTFDFYTADEPGTYRVVLEGLFVGGQVVWKILDIDVRADRV